MSNHSPVGSQHHLVPVSTYVKAWIALLILMALTVLASFWQVGSVGNNVIALGIAVTKAVTVILIFMGVKYSTRLVKIFAAVGFIWVTFMTGIFIDYATRIPVKGFNADFDTTIPHIPQVAGEPSPKQDQGPGYIKPTENPEIQKQLGQ